MKMTQPNRAFTLIELLVVISIIAILAGIALPVFSSVQVKGAQTKALSNAKQIGLGLRLWAGDNNGTYPSYTLDTTTSQPTTTVVPSSNDAFCQLFPTYIQSEQIFYLGKSAWTPNKPDDIIDNPTVSPSTKTLASGENEWAYVVGLNDSSNPSVPLIADGFVTGGETSHKYSKDPTLKGGVWKGLNAIVIRADSSGAVEKVDSTSLTVNGPNGSGLAGGGDIFTTANSANGWLGTANLVVNPK